ncbi:MAG: FecR domain-containing protein, partial [Planctomycetes bacterium]|nr:FecR domain-containing protein [Planctomycetota bacterium]
MPDGSTAYINENTQVEMTDARRLTLVAGEVYVHVAKQSQKQEETASKFVVTTQGRDVTALGTKFLVRRTEQSSTVLVTQGKVRVGGYSGIVMAGQALQLSGKQAVKTVSLERASHQLAWTRELMARANSPLIPAGKHEGGAIVAKDPDGQEFKLSLRKVHIDVHIEDGFARTTIDQTYFNHKTWRLEGTFYFPLPPDASLSRLAMYVGPKRMEGGMVERNRGRDVFETIVHRKKDPALLEWVDGSTFKMRVFPLEGLEEKRIIISYTQRLPAAYSKMSYRFPSGHNLDKVRDLSVKIRVKNGQGLKWKSGSHELTPSVENEDLILLWSGKDVRFDKDLMLSLSSPIAEKKGASFASTVHERKRYLMVRFRPDLPVEGQREKRNWVFLFETSADRDPLLARAQIEVVRSILENVEHEDTFAVVTVATRVGILGKAPLPCTDENVEKALRQLEQVHLIGALDLHQGLTACRPFLNSTKNSFLVHVGTGISILGDITGEAPRGYRS